jgi:hypothetical protein
MHQPSIRFKRCAGKSLVPPLVRGETAVKSSPASLKTAVALAFLALSIAGCSSTSSILGTSSAKGAVVMGEHFTTREVIDHQQNDLVVGVIAAPEKWAFKSDVVWNYVNNSNPVKISMDVQNPANEEAVLSYPPELFFYFAAHGHALHPRPELRRAHLLRRGIAAAARGVCVLHPANACQCAKF